MICIPFFQSRPVRPDIQSELDLVFDDVEVELRLNRESKPPESPSVIHINYMQSYTDGHAIKQQTQHARPESEYIYIFSIISNSLKSSLIFQNYVCFRGGPFDSLGLQFFVEKTDCSANNGK